MPRWQPDTRRRLVEAALGLYAEQGYDETTVADIAARAGVTSRTYFRHFPDKREVLFATGEALRAAIVEGTARALAAGPPYRAVLSGVVAARDVFEPRGFVVAREALIATSAELRERELVKVAAITAALEQLLVDSGCDEPAARMTAVAGVAVFSEATRRWQRGDDRPFAELVAEAAELLRGVAAPADVFVG